MGIILWTYKSRASLTINFYDIFKLYNYIYIYTSLLQAVSLSSRYFDALEVGSLPSAFDFSWGLSGRAHTVKGKSEHLMLPADFPDFELAKTDVLLPFLQLRLFSRNLLSRFLSLRIDVHELSP